MKGPAPATLLRHRGHGELHYDLILASGARCLTLALVPGARGWRWRQQAPHRRRYLSLRQAPVGGGRGCVTAVWHGHASWHRHGAGLAIVLAGRTLLLGADGVVIPRTPPHLPPWMR